METFQIISLQTKCIRKLITSYIGMVIPSTSHARIEYEFYHTFLRASTLLVSVQLKLNYKRKTW